MPRQSKSAVRTPNETIPRQFRLRPETLADLDRLAAHLTRDTGIEHTRTDAIRYAARRAVQDLRPAQT